MRILIILALFLVLYYMFRSLFQPGRREKRTQRTHPDLEEGRDNELVKDPCCQTYVPLNTAFQTRIGGKVLFFCSEECMKRYVRAKRDRSSEVE